MRERLSFVELFELGLPTVASVDSLDVEER